MKKVFSCFAGFAVFFGLFGITPVLAEEISGEKGGERAFYIMIERSGKIKFDGVLSSVSGDSFRMDGWGGEWTVDGSQAKILRKDGKEGGLEEFVRGDILTVNGSASTTAPWHVSARIIKNESFKAEDAHGSGVVSKVREAGEVFTLNLSENKKGVEVRVKEGARVMVNGRNARTADFKEGMRALVWGIWGRDGESILADTVYAVKKVR